MKITIMDCMDGEEEEIIVKCRQMDEQLMKMIRAVKAGREQIVGTKDGKIMRIAPKDVYYFEAVDNRIFLYLEKDVYETKYKLYELEERFRGLDFLRTSKSVIINLAKVQSFAPVLGGRFEAIMKNGEKLVISRQYVPTLKEKLGL